MEATMRQTWAFLFRGYHMTRRYIGWVVVFNFYALVTSATVALIGVAQGNYQLTLTLVVGALLWNYLSWLYNEIAMSIAYERWEGTLEYTFMAPVSRAVHLLGVSLYLVAEQYYDERDCARRSDVVYEPEPCAARICLACWSCWQSARLRLSGSDCSRRCFR